METDSPKDLSFESMIVDLCFHPQKDVIAAGDIEGDITVHSYSTTEQNHLLLTLPHHKKSCRALQFTPSGAKLVTASKDKSIQVVDMVSGSVEHKLKKAHESPLYSLLVVDENIVASGDDDGHFKVWDLRQNKSVMEVKENDEFISDMVIDDSNRVLAATSGDGTLSAFDIRKHKLKIQSELFDSELLSIVKVKGGEKVVVGTGEGVVNIFNWGEWGNISDRMPGHPMSVDCMVPVTRDIIITGSMDGIIRAVNILPNRFIGVIGEHTGFPVENMSRSHCGSYLATCSHDQKIKFWNIKDVENERVSSTKKAKKSRKNKPLTESAKKTNKTDFFSDLAGGEGTSKQDDDNESGENGENESDSDESESETKLSSKGASNFAKSSKNIKSVESSAKDTGVNRDTNGKDDEIDDVDSDFVSDDDDDESLITDDIDRSESDLLNISNDLSSSSSDSDSDTNEGTNNN